MIDSMLQRYNISDGDSYYQALREIMQEVALAGLYRSGFFSKAAFYGGTALRIFHALDRFSEDLDFSLLMADPDFTLDSHFSTIEKEFHALGMNVVITTKKKTRESSIQSAFLKSDTHRHVLNIQGSYQQSWTTPRPVKIKFEVDTVPPAGFSTEELLLLQPFSFYVKCFQLPDLFAGKLHALLYRGWRNRVKGRDWYDFEWYIRHRRPVRLSHFLIRARQSGHLSKEEPLNLTSLHELLHEQIDQLDISQAKSDVEIFINEQDRLKIWSRAYFHQLTDRLEVAG